MERIHNIIAKEGNMLDEIEVDPEIDDAEKDKNVLKHITSLKTRAEGTDHDHEQLPMTNEVPMDKAYKQERSQKRNNLTIQERQDIIKEYENLPNNMSQVRKAEILGLNRTRLRSILCQREKIFACQNTATKHARRGKEDVQIHNRTNRITEEGNILYGVDIETDDTESEGVLRLNAAQKSRDKKDFKSPKPQSSSSLEDEADLDLEADISPITCTKPATDDAKAKCFPCQECGLVLGSKPELVDHMAYIHTDTKHDKLPKSKDVMIIEEVLEDNSGKNGKSPRRMSLTIQEKQTIIKRYGNLPNNISRAQKARMLGIKPNTLVNILSNQENILAFQNTTMKRARHAKEKDVADATLKWVHSARDRNEKISYSIIQRKASEIAGKMGKNFSPRSSWAQRLCKRGNIAMRIEKKDVLANVHNDESYEDNIGDEDTSMVTNDEDDNIVHQAEVNNPINACATPTEDVIEKQFSCQDCELDFDDFDELQHHMAISHDQLYETEEVTGKQMPKENPEKANDQEKVPARTVQTIQQKQDIIKQYENLPDNMPMRRKAEMLGVKRTTLMKFLSNKEKIMSVQNTTRKSLRCGKDEEVEKATLMWLQSAIQSGVSYATIRAKASEIAQEMGKDYKPGAGWAWRFCKRHNINLAKDESEEIFGEEDMTRATDPILYEGRLPLI